MATNDVVSRLVAGARAGLAATFRERAHLPSSPWFAYLGRYGGVIVDRSDNPEEPIPADWRVVCRINNARTDDANVATFTDAVRRLDLSKGAL